MNNEEYLKMLQQLDGKHSVFYHMWLHGKPRFTKEISTAAVAFNEEGQQIDFMLNPDFWESQNDSQKLFVLCHECLHIILDHGHRFFWNKDIDFIKANKATDIAINHMCVNRLGFDRKEIDPNSVYCWTDTVFPENTPADSMNSEWYYNSLNKLTESGEATSNSHEAITVDDHSKMSTKGIEEKLKEISNELTEDEKKFIQDFLEENSNNNNSNGTGTAPGSIWITADTKPVKKKRKWETVIKKWAMQYLKNTQEEESQWARINRRFVMMSDDMFIPTEMEVEIEKREEQKIKVWFFQDTSGSCYGYHKRFFNAAKSLPEDRFDIRMFCFDTRVYETDLKSGKLYGFGGTSFSILERSIQATIKKENTEYPKAVFVITDGYGDRVMPAVAKNWYWFLTPSNSTAYIPAESKVFNLRDFE